MLLIQRAWVCPMTVHMAVNTRMVNSRGLRVTLEMPMQPRALVEYQSKNQESIEQ